jgi:Sec-independent protein secretion pathway component TatC
MQTCPGCHRSLPEINRFCTQCGQRLDGKTSATPASRPNTTTPEQLNIQVLYAMVAALVLAVLFPPWETPPDQQPEFLGFYFILSPPAPEAVVSRMLLTIELVTLTIAGLYGAFLFRRKL